MLSRSSMPSIDRMRCSTIDRTITRSRFGPATDGSTVRGRIVKCAQKVRHQPIPGDTNHPERQRRTTEMALSDAAAREIVMALRDHVGL